MNGDVNIAFNPAVNSISDVRFFSGKEKWLEFFITNYPNELQKIIKSLKENNVLTINYDTLSTYDDNLAKCLLTYPDPVIKDANTALKEFIDTKTDKGVYKSNIRIVGVPQKNYISDIKSAHVNKIISIEGIVKKINQPTSKLVLGVYECARCGEHVSIPQMRFSVHEIKPEYCQCNESKKGVFATVENECEYIDAQEITIGDHNQGSITVALDNDLTGIVKDFDRITFVGIIRKRKKIISNKASNESEFFLECIGIENDMLIAKIPQEEIEQEARDILENKDPIEYIAKSVKRFHKGDEQAVKVLLLTQCNQQVINAKGTHPALNGDSGKGKTDLCKKVGFHLPRDKFLETSLSGKGLFYAEILPGTTVFCDDLNIDEDFRQTLKRTTTNFNEETVHITVINGEKATKVIPPRVCWWLTSVMSDDDDQVLNREIPITIDESKKIDEHVFDLQCEQLSMGVDDMEETRDVLISREIMRILKSEMFYVKAPYVRKENIIWNNKENRRNFSVFSDVLKSYALANRYQREIMEENGKKTIIASIDDFEKAVKVYCEKAANKTTNLTDIELKIIRYIESRMRIKDTDRVGAEITDIQKHINRSRTYTQKLLRGVKGQGGLLNKVPALTYEEETRIDELSAAERRSRPKNRYMIDIEEAQFFLNSYSNVVGFTESFKNSDEYKQYEEQRNRILRDAIGE